MSMINLNDLGYTPSEDDPAVRIAAVNDAEVLRPGTATDDRPASDSRVGGHVVFAGEDRPNFGLSAGYPGVVRLDADNELMVTWYGMGRRALANRSRFPATELIDVSSTRYQRLCDEIDAVSRGWAPPGER